MSANRTSSMISIVASLLAAGAFCLLANYRNFSIADSAIGAVWVFVLTVIIMLSVVPSVMKRWREDS
jgi:membrane protein YdbS with pleckstrin-like domain